MLSGDLQGPDGSSAAFEVSRLSTRYAVRIVERARQTEAYGKLAAFIRPDVLDAFYVRYAYDRIRPALATFCVASYGSPRARGETGTSLHVEDPLLLPLFSEVWDVSGCRISGSSRRATISFAGYAKRFVGNLWNRTGRFVGAVSPDAGTAFRVAVEAGEGTDATRRSDLFWIHGVELDRRRLLYYFTHQYEYLKPIGRTKCELEKLGIPWVSLKRGAAGPWTLPWSPGFVPSWTTTEFLRAVDPLDLRDPWTAWIVATAREFLPEVDYWRAFFRAHRVKVQFSISPAHDLGLAKRMALDLEGGVQIGTQRNFIATPDDTHSRRPQHVFFTWGDPSHAFDFGAFNCDKTLLVSGFVYDAAHPVKRAETEEVRSRLKAAGARFTVALLDNAFGDFHITRTMMVRFYRTFLTWLLETPDAGMVIKPKKPRQLDELHEIRGLMEQAQRTGRCVELPDALGRFAMDASSCADLTVGMFIASAVIEAAIAGHRGVHCDLSRQRSHPFYRWGDEKVVFDDANRLIEAIGRYMRNPADEPHLGDHGPILTQLDPFRDGHAGRRVGEYVSRLLEAFDAGLSREAALASANERYAGAWGADKVMRLVDRRVGVEQATSCGRLERMR